MDPTSTCPHIGMLMEDAEGLGIKSFMFLLCHLCICVNKHVQAYVCVVCVVCVLCVLYVLCMCAVCVLCALCVLCVYTNVHKSQRSTSSVFVYLFRQGVLIT